MTQVKSALAGLKVVDFGVVGVAPTTAKYLGHHGATVIRIESHTAPDVQRTMRPYKDDIPGLDRAAVFAACNNSKLSATLNLRNPGAGEVRRRLAQWAEVMICGFPPGTMEKLGLDYGTVSKVNPQIVYFSTCLGGQDGPLAHFRAYGHQVAALSGVSELIGWPDREPTGVPFAYTDWISPRFGVAAVMAALDYRRRTGQGQFIDQSQLETTLHYFAPVIMDYAVNGTVQSRMGNRLPYAAPHGVYPCQGQERWVAIAVFTDEEWQRLGAAMGAPDWAKEPRFATLTMRKRHEDELDELVGKWTANEQAGEVMKLLQAAGVKAGLVQSVEDLFHDPQLAHREHFRYFEHAVMGRHAYENLAFRFSKTPDRQGAAPAMGAHNEYVLKELLGFTEDDMADLYVEGVITTDADLPDY